MECGGSSDGSHASRGVFTQEENRLLMRAYVLLSAFAASYGEKEKVGEKVGEL